MLDIDYFKKPNEADAQFHAHITKKGEQAESDLHTPIVHPIPDAPTTVEEEFQSAVWRALINPATPTENNLRVLYARYDTQARGRATGILPQTWDFDGVMPTRADVSKEFYARYEGESGAGEVIAITIFEG